MKFVDTRGSISVAVHSETPRDKPASAFATARLRLNRYSVDEDGCICITPPLSIEGLRDAVEILKAQLDRLVDDALAQVGNP